MHNVTNKAPYRIEHSGSGWATVDLFVYPAYESGAIDVSLGRAIVSEGILDSGPTSGLLIGGHPVSYTFEERSDNREAFFARVHLSKDQVPAFLENIEAHQEEAQRLFTAEIEAIVSLVRLLRVIRKTDRLRDMAGLTEPPSKKGDTS